MKSTVILGPTVRSRMKWARSVLLGASLLISACTVPAPATSQLDQIKLLVERTGIHEISSDDLRHAGFALPDDPAALDLNTDHAAVPFELSGSGSRRALRFYGRAPAAEGDQAVRVYWLRRGVIPPTGSGPSPVAGSPVSSDAGMATLRIEKQNYFSARSVRYDDRWMWANLLAPADVTATADLPGLAEGTVEIRVRLLGVSNTPADPDHHVALRVNGQTAGEVRWDGATDVVLLAALPGNTLKSRENELSIVAPGDTEATADAVLLDWVEIRYPVSPATEPAGAPLTPRLEIPARGNPLAEARGADLIVVTAPGLAQPLEPLLETRRQQGLRVAVFGTDQVADVYGPGPAGIRALVQDALARWPAPASRYLLLVGDATYDPRGFLGAPSQDTVPSWPVYTSFSGWTSSDVAYGVTGDVPDGVGIPRLAVGRLPAASIAEARTMVQKILTFEREEPGVAWRDAALLVTDNDEAGFAEEAGRFAAALEGWQSGLVTVEGDGSAARTALTDAFGAGVGLVGYFGHGSLTLWAQERVFGLPEVEKLANGKRLPLVFTVTCLSGYFEHPVTASLGEALLRREGGGAVAALVPSSAALLSHQAPLAQALANALAKNTGGARPARLGDLVLEAQTEAPTGLAGEREVLLTLNLLGDPTLLLR